ncbi:hypothetical protein ACFQRR_14910, partial [Nocardioides sp. GCM10030258]
EIADLRDLKSRTRELGSAAAPRAIAQWAEVTFAAVDDAFRAPSDGLRAQATDGFLSLVDRWAPDRP